MGALNHGSASSLVGRSSSRAEVPEELTTATNLATMLPSRKVPPKVMKGSKPTTLKRESTVVRTGAKVTAMFDDRTFTMDSAPAITPELAKAWYRDMLLIRRFEEKAGQLYGMGKIGGFCHLYIGQEAVAVGIKSASIEGDSFITGYRDHGHMLACGMDPKRVMSELTGRADGYSAGKGGSMHIFSRAVNFFGGHGIVGSQVPIGTGIAFAYKYRAQPFVCMAFFGDGATNQGQIYEAMNMASLWKLPVIYVLENNRYGMGTSVGRASAESDRLTDRFRSVGIPAEQVDGMNVEEMYDCAHRALAYVRQGNGPCMIEAKTYRYRGHSMSDPAKYRTREEVDSYRNDQDPIDGLRARMLQRWPHLEKELGVIDEEVKKIAADASDHAQEAPFPAADQLYKDVYAD